MGGKLYNVSGKQGIDTNSDNEMDFTPNGTPYFVNLKVNNAQGTGFSTGYVDLNNDGEMDFERISGSSVPSGPITIYGTFVAEAGSGNLWFAEGQDVANPVRLYKVLNTNFNGLPIRIPAQFFTGDGNIFLHTLSSNVDWWKSDENSDSYVNGRLYTLPSKIGIDISGNGSLGLQAVGTPFLGNLIIYNQGATVLSTGNIDLNSDGVADLVYKSGTKLSTGSTQFTGYIVYLSSTNVYQVYVGSVNSPTSTYQLVSSVFDGLSIRIPQSFFNNDGSVSLHGAGTSADWKPYGTTTSSPNALYANFYMSSTRLGLDMNGDGSIDMVPSSLPFQTSSLAGLSLRSVSAVVVDNDGGLRIAGDSLTSFTAITNDQKVYSVGTTRTISGSIKFFSNFPCIDLNGDGTCELNIQSSALAAGIPVAAIGSFSPAFVSINNGGGGYVETTATPTTTRAPTTTRQPASVPITTENMNRVGSVLSGVTSQNSIIQSIQNNIRSPTGLEALGSTEKKAFGVLAVIPQGASTSATQAAVSLITGEDSNGRALTGFAAAANSLYKKMTTGSSTALTAIVSLVTTDINSLGDPKLVTMHRVLSTTSSISSSALDTLAVVVSGEATQSSNIGAYNLQSVFSHGDGLASTASERVVAVLNGDSTDKVSRVVVSAIMSISVVPEAAAAVASILELTSTSDGTQVTTALSNLPIAESVGSGALRNLVGSIQSVLANTANAVDSNGVTGNERVTAVMIWMFRERV